ncbi:MAG: SurA N-terminal domain-containing protein, partial [Deltaproteobacteria bacterium]|nr:SurA N-terminal domain-containing protein [Deltaproteobacteria bacterium]
MAGGCANKAAVVKDGSVTVKSAAEQAPAVIVPRGRVTNAIAAIVNDEVVTLYEVNREALPLIREAEKKSSLDDAARRELKRNALERVVEKKLVEQKIKELNIKVTEEEIRAAIDDVKKQNNMPSQEALVAALANQGLSFDQYRTQLQEQIEKLKLVSAEVRSKIHVSESELREFYDANLPKYTEEESYRARHIFFRTNEKSSAEDIKLSMTKALMVLAEVKGGKDFVELA